MLCLQTRVMEEIHLKELLTSKAECPETWQGAQIWGIEGGREGGPGCKDVEELPEEQDEGADMPW